MSSVSILWVHNPNRVWKRTYYYHTVKWENLGIECLVVFPHQPCCRCELSAGWYPPPSPLLQHSAVSIVAWWCCRDEREDKVRERKKGLSCHQGHFICPVSIVSVHRGNRGILSVSFSLSHSLYAPREAQAPEPCIWTSVGMHSYLWGPEMRVWWESAGSFQKCSGLPPVPRAMRSLPLFDDSIHGLKMGFQNKKGRKKQQTKANRDTVIWCLTPLKWCFIWMKCHIIIILLNPQHTHALYT